MVTKAILTRGFNANTTIPHPFDSKTVKIGNVDLTGVPKLNRNDWVKEQGADVDIDLVVELVKSNWHLQYTCKEEDSSIMHELLKYKQDLFIRNNLLYRRVKLKNHNSVINQFVLPKTFCRRPNWHFMMITDIWARRKS